MVGSSYQFDLDEYKKYSDISFLVQIKEKLGGENFCATIQYWLEEVATKYLNEAYKKYPVDNLCLAGGAVANVIMNYKIWQCVVCGFIYDESKGLPEDNIAPNTRWEDIDDDWECPDCGAMKEDFIMSPI